ncbi:unnamed protein product [Caenorhabditis bovis]|uniref:Lebercilin domain-containing protein n=1 Tax=Caenorhabditis bovis TaxID=2654633 RepID=A0A8S1ENP9_9PELO|nr:unnamed protein product [Caenorhabditis bovis]
MPDRRTKSVDKVGKLPPVVSQQSRQSAEAIRKAYSRPKTALKNSRPMTTQYSLAGLSNYQNGKFVDIGKRGTTSAIKRSQSESRSLVKSVYGRSPSRERIDDLRDELFDTKKKMAAIENEKKVLHTQMQRLMRDSEKREKYLQRLVTSKFQPAELNDTHMARTLTAIRRNEMAKEQIIQVQSKELELAKQYAEQNSQLKLRLKNIKDSYIEIQEKAKKREEEMKRVLQQAKKEAESRSQEAVQALQKEKKELFEENMRNLEKYDAISIELQEAYKELSLLRTENDSLQAVIQELQSQLEEKQHEKHRENHVEIPKLDMTRMDSTTSPNPSAGSYIDMSEIDSQSIANAIGEIVGAHVERKHRMEKSL